MVQYLLTSFNLLWKKKFNQNDRGLFRHNFIGGSDDSIFFSFRSQHQTQVGRPSLLHHHITRKFYHLKTLKILLEMTESKLPDMD